MWEQIARPRHAPPHAVVLLLGSLAAKSLAFLGPVSNTEILTYYRLEQPSKGESSPLCTLDVYRLQVLDRGIVDPMPISGRCLVLCMLNWLETEFWADQLRFVGELATRKKWDLLLSIGGDLKKITMPLASRAAALDSCHQYIRTAAIKLGASLAYSTDMPLDMRAVLAKVLELPLSESSPPESLYGTQVVIYGNDSKDKVRAVNPDFDFESAWSGEFNLPILHQKTEKPNKSVRGLPEEVEHLLLSFKCDKEEPGKQVSKAVLEGTDDKNIISEFFTTMVQRST